MCANWKRRHGAISPIDSSPAWRNDGGHANATRPLRHKATAAAKVADWKGSIMKGSQSSACLL